MLTVKSVKNGITGIMSEKKRGNKHDKQNSISWSFNKRPDIT